MVPGKSTLCNLIFGLHLPDAGEMRLAGEPYRPTGPADALAAGIAMVHQHFSLVPDLPWSTICMLGRERGILRRAAYAANAETGGARVTDCRSILMPSVGDLSVGERQRVEIVKCLIREPRGAGARRADRSAAAGRGGGVPGGMPARRRARLRRRAGDAQARRDQARRQPRDCAAQRPVGRDIPTLRRGTSTAWCGR